MEIFTNYIKTYFIFYLYPAVLTVRQILNCSQQLLDQNQKGIL